MRNYYGFLHKKTPAPPFTSYETLGGYLTTLALEHGNSSSHLTRLI